MKMLLILFILTVITYSCRAADTEKAANKKIQYEQLESRLSAIEVQIKEINQIETLKYNTLSQQVAKLESKFDTYFLWGYGTLIALILAILGNGLWLKKKKEIVEVR